MATEPTQAATSAHDDDYRFGAPPKDLPKYLPGPETRVQSIGSVRIESIDLARKADRTRFLDVADAIQSHDKNYIAPLRLDRMRFLDTRKNKGLQALEIGAFIAVRDGRDVGRITAHIDRAYDAYHAVKAGWFGFFESIDDTTVAHGLLSEAVRWTKARGAHEIIGPNCFTTNHQIGLLVENFDRPPFIEMTYNPPYYERLIASYGFGRAKDLLVFMVDVTQGTDNPKLKRYNDIAEKVKKRYKLRIRHPDLSNFEKETLTVFKLYNECWQKNWGFVPITEAEFATAAADLKQIIVPSLVQIIEDQNGKPIAFALCLPNLNEVLPKNGKLLPLGWLKLLLGLRRAKAGKVKHARLILLGVVPGYRQRGLEGILCIETALRARDLGIEGGEIGWTLEDNAPVNNAATSFGGKIDRRYRLLGLDLR